MEAKQLKLTFLLAVLMSMVGAKAFAHDIEVKNADGVTIYYAYTNNKTELAVSYRGSDYLDYSNEYSGVVNIPESVIYGKKTYPVTSIGKNAFNGCSRLISVTIPNSVTSIEEQAFYNCTSLSSVIIPNSVTSIGSKAFGSEAFSGCNQKKVIWLPSTPPSGYGNVRADVHYVPNDSYTSLSSKTVYPYLALMFEVDGVKYVPGSPSEKTCDAIDCVYSASVENIKIGNTVTYRGIAMTVKNVNSYLCYANPYIKNVEVEYNGGIGNYTFYDCSGLTSVTIGNSVTSIGSQAFRDCSGLTSVTIPNSVTSIGDEAFYKCSSLTSVTIGNSVTSIGEAAFSWCKALTSIDIPNSVTSIGSRAFDYCSGLTSVTIGNSVTSIGESAFLGCSGLTSIDIPNSVTSIGYGAFSYCSGLTSVTIPNSVTSIGYKAFSGCSGLTSVTIPNSVTSIGYEAFRNCTGLTSVTIGNSVTSIGSKTFEGCIGLTSVTMNSNAIVSKDYTSSSSLKDIFGSQVKQYIMGDSVKSIGDYAFYNCNSLTSVTIPNSVTSIGQYAFQNCNSLTSVTIGNSVTSIRSWAFRYCTGLTSVTIPNSVTSIGSKTFEGCIGLTSVTIPNSVTSIGSKTFEGCIGLTSVTINSNALVSKNYYSSSSLKDIFGSQVKQYVLGDDVKSIGNYAFAGCTNVTKLTSCATTPPICGTQALNDINKWDCTLFVPIGSLSAYQAADQWKEFFLIEESDVTAISRIYDDEAEGRIVGIYDLNGRKLERLQRGMNIVRMSDGTTKKVVIK